MTLGYKQRIAEQFGQAASTYHVDATLQREGAVHLSSLIATHLADLPAGPILEIGCGTGFITQELIQKLPQRSLEITDLSPAMVNFCRANLIIPVNQQPQLSFHTLDAERVAKPTKTYAAIVGGFVIQWFKDLNPSLHQIIDQLSPQGMLFLSFPTCHSFPEWKQICGQLQLPWTANPLPDPDNLLVTLPSHAQLYQAEILEWATVHASAADFFREMKAIGAGVNQSQTRLTQSQMKTLIRYWDAQALGNVEVHYQIAFWVIQRLG